LATPVLCKAVLCQEGKNRCCARESPILLSEHWREPSPSGLLRGGTGCPHLRTSQRPRGVSSSPVPARDYGRWFLSFPWRSGETFLSCRTSADSTFAGG